MPALGRAAGRRFDQNQLADARLAAYRQGTTGLGRSIDGRGQDLKLVLTTNDLKRRPAHRRNHPLSLPRRAAGAPAAIRGPALDLRSEHDPSDSC
jgi:hypothetical protein